MFKYMLLVPVVAVFCIVKFSVNVGLDVFAFVANVVVKLVPLNIIDGVVNVPLGPTVIFGADMFPASACPNTFAFVSNVVVKS